MQLAGSSPGPVKIDLPVFDYLMRAVIRPTRAALCHIEAYGC